MCIKSLYFMTIAQKQLIDFVRVYRNLIFGKHRYLPASLCLCYCCSLCAPHWMLTFILMLKCLHVGNSGRNMKLEVTILGIIFFVEL